MRISIREWLGRLGLGEYAQAFETEKIERDDLRDLTEADLERLGLPMGPRKRLLRALCDLERDPSDSAGSTDEARTSDYSPSAAAGRPVPAPLAEKILKARASIEGERKQVTVLFADVNGSTDLVQHLDAEEVSALFDPLQKIMIDAVHDYEGTVNEVLGDGVMAIFGAPIAHEDHALRACRAALDMQAAVRRFAEQSTTGSPSCSLELRVGLNSGEVVVRAINNDLTMSYSAMGMTTHLAARMEQSAEAGTIRVTSDTFRLVSGLIEARPLGELDVKGVSRRVTGYELRGLGKARTRLEAASLEGLSRFVGREPELCALEERLADAEGGRGQVVSIIGDPGIGKSRLLLEFRERLGDRASWVEGRCLSFGQSMAFHPLVDLLRSNFRIDDQDAPEIVRAKVSARVERIGRDLEPILPYLFYMLGVAPAGDPVHAMDAQIRRAETFDALRQLLVRAAVRKPQVMVYEDLHWSDHATREFLAFLLDSIPRSRVLILLSFRTGHTFPLGGRTYASRLVLQNLSAPELEQMAKGLLASGDLPPELHALVRRKAEGNPFFVEELIKSLSETGAIRHEDERWVLGRPLDQIVVPDTIQDVLMSRIDHLEDEPRQALQLAAVIGREFTQRLLHRIADIRSGTDVVLRELQTIELIYEKALFPELAYMFKHALTQDVAYGSLLSPRRRQLHRRIGEAIEELYADRLAEHAAVLAHHFEQGEDWERAAMYFERAAEHAAAAFATQEALVLLDQALAALDRDPERGSTAAKRSDLHARKADLHMVRSEHRDAHAASAQAATIARDLADAAREGTALAGMGLASFFLHRFDRTVEESQHAIDLGQRIGSDGIIAAGQCWIAYVEAVTGRLDEARSGFAAAHRRAGKAGSLFHQAVSSAVLSQIDNWQGDFGRSEAWGKRSRQQADEGKAPLPRLISLFSLGLPLTGKGAYDEALAIFSEGLQLAEKVGDEIWRNRLLNCLGWLSAECGDADRAIRLNEEGVGHSRTRGDPEVIANCELNLGDLFRAKGDVNLSRELLEGVHGLARKPSTSDWMRWRYSQHLFAGLGETWLALDDPAKANDFCNQCLDLATGTDSKKYLARGWRLRGEIAVARLQWEEAEEALRKALAFAKRVGNPTQLWRTHSACGELYRDTRRPDLAGSSFAASRKVIDGIGQSLRSPELKEGFERSQVIRSACEQSAIG
jgi:class 3 adenylate cyclase/tetratricopeptide (TPR) repeat protein